jgi:hypothetical protein
MLCQFESGDGDLIRCSLCGTERRTEGDPRRYIRRCGADPPLSPRSATDPVSPSLERALSVHRGEPCIHRGAVLEADVCNVCGMKGQPFDVFACELHGKCMVRRFRNDRPELAVCMNCDDFKAKEPYAGGAPMKTKLG